MAEDLVKDVRLLQVVEVLAPADKGGDRELAFGQQGKKLSGEISAGTASMPKPLADFKAASTSNSCGTRLRGRSRARNPARNSSQTRPGKRASWRA